jgi:hypothetical protein
VLETREGFSHDVREVVAILRYDPFNLYISTVDDTPDEMRLYVDVLREVMIVRHPSTPQRSTLIMASGTAFLGFDRPLIKNFGSD